MAEVKWIKITTDIFDDEKILLIESLPEADSIIVIWFKLLCLAGKQNNSGVFMLGDRIAYTDKMLATIFRRKETTVQMALQTFEQFGMIEIVDGVITIPKWEKHQSLDKMEQAREQTRIRVARHREKQKQLAEKNNVSADSNASCNVTVTQGNADRIEEDKEIDIDIEKKEKKASTKTSYDSILSNSVFDESLKELYLEYIKMRKLIKAPMTDRALTMLISKVNQLEPNSIDRQKKMLETAIMNNWKSVYPLKDEPKPQQKTGFDLDEFFNAACLDSEKKRIENPPKTAGNDESIRERAEQLKRQLS